MSRHKILFSAIVVASLCVGTIMLAVVPLYQSTSTLLDKITTRSKIREDVSGRVTILSQLDANVLAERVRILDSALPPRKDVLLYMASINGLSNDLGLSFGGINLAPGVLSEASSSAATKKATQTAGLESLESEIRIQGNRESIYAFLRAIEEVLPLMQINDIKVSVGTQNQYSLSLTLGMLWAKSDAAEVKGQVTLFGEEEEKYFNQLATYRLYPPITTQVGTASAGVKSDVFSPLRLQP